MQSPLLRPCRQHVEIQIVEQRARSRTSRTLTVTPSSGSMSHLIARVSTSSSQNLVSDPTSASPVNADDASNHAQVKLTIIFGIIASVLALAALVVEYLQVRKYKRPSQDQGASQPSEVWDLLEVQ